MTNLLEEILVTPIAIGADRGVAHERILSLLASLGRTR